MSSLGHSRSHCRIESLESRALFSAGYSFDPVAFLNAPTPGPVGDTYSPAGGFEPAGLNNSGEAAFAAYINSNGQAAGEGVYTEQADELTQLIRQGTAAPGGETFGGFGTFSPGALNNRGDVVINFGRDPATPTLGINAALYKYSAGTGKVSALVIPDVTKSPTGGTFQGVFFHASINDAGQTVFPGIIHTRLGPGGSGDLGTGIFEAGSSGKITSIAVPGNLTSDGHTLDYAVNPSINSQGDVAFGGHVSGDPEVSVNPPFPEAISNVESVYFRDHLTKKLVLIAHQGGAIPASAGGGVYDYAFGPSVNDQDQVLFIGAIRQSPKLTDVSKDPFGVFVSSHGTTVAVARPGTAMPGGGVFASASFYVSNYGINNSGKVVFNCTLKDGTQGLYAWNHGRLSLIAKTGTVIPGIGTIGGFDFGAGQPSGGALVNDNGQVLFGATLKQEGGALFVATLHA